jgi:hypothetical protein
MLSISFFLLSHSRTFCTTRRVFGVPTHAHCACVVQEVDELKTEGADPEAQLEAEAEAMDAVIHITQNT